MSFSRWQPLPSLRHFKRFVQIRFTLLLEAGYDVNAVGPRNGYTPLHDAVWANNLPALKILVANGGDITIKGKDGNTPLEKAIAEDKPEIVAYLQSLK